MEKRTKEEDFAAAQPKGRQRRPRQNFRPAGVIMKNLYSVFVEFYGKELFFVFLFIHSAYVYIIIGKYEQIVNGK